MFDYAAFAWRNPSYITENARQQYAVRKAMREYREAHPVCAATGSTKELHVHHVLPVSVYPEGAADPENFITLNYWAHFVIGHRRNWQNFNPYVREHAKAIYESTVVTSERTD